MPDLSLTPHHTIALVRYTLVPYPHCLLRIPNLIHERYSLLDVTIFLLDVTIFLLDVTIFLLDVTIFTTYRPGGRTEYEYRGLTKALGHLVRVSSISRDTSTSRLSTR